MFLDHDDGGVYFNVLDNGIPYLVGTERLKASHSMSGYHSMELCYLATTYTNLLITGEPLELHFKPKAVSFPDGVLRVAPDLLPPGRVRMTDVWVNDTPYDDFDGDALTVNLPPNEEVKVKVRLEPTSTKLEIKYDYADGVATLTLDGTLDQDQIPAFARALAGLGTDRVSKTVLMVKGLKSIVDDAVRELVFVRQKMDLGDEFLVVGANEQVAAAFTEVGDSEAGTGGDWELVDKV